MSTLSDYTCYCTLEQAKRAFALGAPLAPLTKDLFGECPAVNIPTISVADVIQGIDVGELAKNTSYSEFDEKYLLPTTQQMRGWLRDKGLSTSVMRLYRATVGNYIYDARIFTLDKKNKFVGDIMNNESFPQAELAVIDLALNYLENKKKKIN